MGEVALPQNGGIMTDLLSQLSQAWPEKIHWSCKWAQAHLFAVLRAFDHSTYFTLSKTPTFDNHKFVIEVQAGNRVSRRHMSTLTADMGHYHLRVTIESREDPGEPHFKIHKEWRRGYPNRPKWRKFGVHACLLLKRHHGLKDVEYVMES
jgi:hypothetical protein